MLIILGVLIDSGGIETECGLSAIRDDLILALQPQVESENSSKSVHSCFSMASDNNQHNHSSPPSNDKDGFVLVNRLNQSRSPYVGFS